MQSTFRQMYTFSTVSFANYILCVYFKEQVGYATQAESFKHRQADYLLSNHNRHVAGMAMTYKHTNTLRQND